MTSPGASTPRPADGLHVEWIDDEAVLLDTNTNRVHYLNPSAAIVFALIEEHGYEKGMQQLDERYGSSPQMKEDLPKLLDDMLKKGLLVDGRDQ